MAALRVVVEHVATDPLGHPRGGGDLGRVVDPVRDLRSFDEDYVVDYDAGDFDIDNFDEIDPELERRVQLVRVMVALGGSALTRARDATGRRACDYLRFGYDFFYLRIKRMLWV